MIIWSLAASLKKLYLLIRYIYKMKIINRTIDTIRIPFSVFGGRTAGKWNNSKIFLIILVIGIFISMETARADAGGEIHGLFFENAAPCSLQINIHNAVTGLYFGKTETDSNGVFVFSNLPYGKYYLITHPAGVGVRMPLQWKTDSLEVTKKHPQYIVSQVDGFVAKTIYPQDGESLDLEEVSDQNPLIFRWKPYCTAARYEIEVYITDKSQDFISNRIDTCMLVFNGVFPDGSHFKKRLYRWELRVYPDRSEWIGTSKPQDFTVGDLGKINTYEGKYIKLEFPRWYESTIETLDLIHLLDNCYLLEKQLTVGQVPMLEPLPGEKQAFLYDPTITFAYSGNPIHFGKNHINENTFPLFLTFHEMGHNFQFGGLPGFEYLMGSENYERTLIFFGFAEGLATLASLYITEKIDKNDLKPAVRDLFTDENKSMRERFGTALEFYEKQGPDRNHITPDIIDGICIRLGDQYGWDIFPDFFRIFLKNDINDQIFQLAGDDDTKRTTIYVAAFSVAAGDDLRRKFHNWDFPLDNKYYRTILPLVHESLGKL
jgi:hypothetical protein